MKSGLRLAAQVLVDDDAVDEEEVVERLRAGDDDLVVRPASVDARREQDAVLRCVRPIGSCSIELRVEVRRDLRRLEHGRRRRGDGDRFRDRADGSSASTRLVSASRSTDLRVTVVMTLMISIAHARKRLLATLVFAPRPPSKISANRWTRPRSLPRRARILKLGAIC